MTDYECLRWVYRKLESEVPIEYLVQLARILRKEEETESQDAPGVVECHHDPPVVLQESGLTVWPKPGELESCGKVRPVGSSGSGACVDCWHSRKVEP